MIAQSLRFKKKPVPDIAEKYFYMIGVLNDLELAKREVQMLAFTAVNGNIGPQSMKKRFVEEYGSSLATVGNMVSRLSKLGVLKKEGRSSVVVTGPLSLDFSKGIKLDIELIPVLADKEKENNRDDSK